MSGEVVLLLIGIGLLVLGGILRRRLTPSHLPPPEERPPDPEDDRAQP